jgi:nitrite reductase/ring-hydroxylating ferredoxin subunit
LSAGEERRSLVLERVSALGVGEARTFAFDRGGHPEQGFLLRLATGFVAYVNRCPHWHVDLDYGEGRFYDAELDRIFCTTHGALFVPQTGRCDAGPCVGESLEPVTVVITGDDAEVLLPASPRIVG